MVVVEVGGEEKGDELKNLSWRKGRWREKVNRRQLCQLGEHENLGRGGGSNRVMSGALEVTVFPLKSNIH